MAITLVTATRGSMETVFGVLMLTNVPTILTNAIQDCIEPKPNNSHKIKHRITKIKKSKYMIYFWCISFQPGLANIPNEYNNSDIYFILDE